MADPRRKQFWKLTRWATEAVLALVIAYPFSAGPAMYLVCRGWTPGYWMMVYEPCEDAAKAVRLIDSYRAYTQWWGELAITHERDSL